MVYLSGREEKRGGVRGQRKGKQKKRTKKRKTKENRGGELLEIIHAVSAIILWQQSEELSVGGVLLPGCLQTNFGVFVIDLVDEETASVLKKIKSASEIVHAC